jgi:dihydroorotase
MPRHLTLPVRWTNWKASPASTAPISMARRESWTVPESFAFGEAQLKPLGGGEMLLWKLE